MLKRLFSFLGTAAVFAGTIWAGVVAWWQHIHHVPSIADVIGYLIALPLGTLTVYGLLGRGIDAVRKRWETVAATPPEAAPAKAAGSNALPSVPRAALLYAAVRTGLGDDAANVDSAARAGAAAPLDATLRNAEGFPVRAARVASLSAQAVEAAQQAWLAHASMPCADHQARTLALLHEVLAHASVAALHAMPSPERQIPGATQRPTLHATVLLPGAWHAAASETAAAALRTLLAATPGADALMLHMRPAADARAVIGALDGAVAGLDTASGSAIGLTLLAAAHSGIADDIDSVPEFGQLPADGATHALPLGEGAVALVLAPVPDDPSSASPHPLPPGDSRALAPRLLRSTAASRAELTQGLDTALAQAGLAADKISAVYADAGTLSACALPLARMTAERLPQLEPLVDSYGLDKGCGSLGVAGPLLAVALAAEHAEQHGKPAVALTLADTSHQAICVVEPTPAAV